MNPANRFDLVFASCLILSQLAETELHSWLFLFAGLVALLASLLGDTSRKHTRRMDEVLEQDEDNKK